MVDELAALNLVARNSIGHIGAAQLLLRPATIPKDCGVGGQLEGVVVRRQFPVPASSGKTVRHRPQPRRRSRSQQRAAYHRHRTPTDRPENQGLCYSSDSRRAFQTRRHSSLEALPLPERFFTLITQRRRRGDQRYTRSPLDKQKGVRGSQYTS